MPMPDLGAELIHRTEQAIAERDQASGLLRQSVLEVERLKARVRDNQPDTAVLARAAEIEAAHQRLGLYQQWRNERIGLDAELAGAEAGLRAGMRSLGVAGAFAQVETLRTRAASAARGGGPEGARGGQGRRRTRKAARRRHRHPGRSGQARRRAAGVIAGA